jgi:hypothetical protein
MVPVESFDIFVKAKAVLRIVIKLLSVNLFVAPRFPGLFLAQNSLVIKVDNISKLACISSFTVLEANLDLLGYKEIAAHSLVCLSF